MGTQRDHLDEITAESAEARHDALADDTGVQSAGPPFPISDLGTIEEFI